jgi:AcrR family transcriptional regulator
MTRTRATRARLLKTASRLFAERGFKRVTVREICRAARANVASVNYHFGDKLGLYREVVQVAIDAMREQLGAAKAAGVGAGPEERLRRYIAIVLARLMDARNETFPRILQREMLEPTPVLDVVVSEGFMPRIEYLSGIVAEMIGCDPSDPGVRRSVGSIQAQFAAYMPNAIADRMGWSSAASADIETVSAHLADFAVAGVYAAGRRHRAAHQVGGGGAAGRT